MSGLKPLLNEYSIACRLGILLLLVFQADSLPGLEDNGLSSAMKNGERLKNNWATCTSTGELIWVCWMMHVPAG